MKKININEGDLLAYLDGKRLPHVEVALRNQPQLKEQLKVWREVDQFLHQRFGRILCPDSQDLVDVVTGQANATQKWRVLTYLQQSTAGCAEMLILCQALAEAEAEQYGL